MDILSLNKIVLITILLTILSCNKKEKEENRLKEVEAECFNKTDVEGLALYFSGYSYDEIKNLEVVQKSSKESKYILQVPEKIEDSLRKQRRLYINNKINIRDTLIITFPNGEKYTLCNFKNSVRPEFTMFSRNWGCRLYELEVNGGKRTGNTASFIKKGFKFL